MNKPELEITESEEEEEITPQFIIKNKPNVSVVREFFRYNLKAIKDEDEENFENA